MAVYKSIMSGGGRNLHFALVDDKTDKVETIDLKKWLKSNVRDNSSKDSKERVIKSILKGQKQFNKKVDFNMWAKKTKPSFEQTMDYFMKNGFVSNITKKGIKVYEGVESVNEGKKRYYQQDRVGSAKYVISYHDGKQKHKDGSDFFGIQTFKNKKDLAKFVNTLHKGGYVYGFNESEEDGVPQGYNPMVESKTKESKVIQKIYTYTKTEKKFYDELAKHEVRIGQRDYAKFIIMALKGFGINPRQYKRIPDAEEKLYQTVSKK